MNMYQMNINTMARKILEDEKNRLRAAGMEGASFSDAIISLFQRLSEYEYKKYTPEKSVWEKMHE